jgi:hypothetical protein
MAISGCAPAQRPWAIRNAKTLRREARENVELNAQRADVSEEPTGDITAPGLVFVSIETVTAVPPSVTFDAIQSYHGTQAISQAAKDHKTVPANGVYTRNQFVHPQTLPVAKSATVVLPVPGSIAPTLQQDPAGPVKYTSFVNLVRLFRAEPATYSNASYLLDFDGSTVTAILKASTP